MNLDPTGTVHAVLAPSSGTAAALAAIRDRLNGHPARPYWSSETTQAVEALLAAMEQVQQAGPRLPDLEAALADAGAVVVRWLEAVRYARSVLASLESGGEP